MVDDEIESKMGIRVKDGYAKMVMQRWLCKDGYAKMVIQRRLCKDDYAKMVMITIKITIKII